MTANLHIGLVTETFPPEVNGVAMTLGRLVAGVMARGHRVSLYRPRQRADDMPRINGHYSEHLFRGLSIPRYSDLRFGLPSSRQLARLWRSEPPDAVYVATEGPLGWSAVKAANALAIPVTSGFHTNFHSYSHHYGAGFLKPAILGYLRRLHRATACTLVPTAQLAAELVRDGFGCVRVMQRGVDTRLFHSGRRRRALRDAWGLGGDDIACLFVGRIAPEKNITELVGTFRHLHKTCGRARLIMVGEGPLLKQLKQRHPDIVFCGMRTGEDLAAHFASGDIFLFPSHSETYGNVVTEAMASGLAVIAYDEAAAHEHIRHDVNGLLADSGERDFAALATALCRDPDRIRRLGAAAEAHAAGLSWDAIVDRFLELLQSPAGATSP